MHFFCAYACFINLCQAPCVQSHQRQPMSAVAIAACEVQVSAADSQTVPTVVTGVSKPLCCRLILTFTLTSENLSLYTSLLLLLVHIQLCSPRCWHLDSNYCRTRYKQSQLRFVLSLLLLHPRLLETFKSDIPLFTLTWPAKHSPNQGWESTHRLHLYPLGNVYRALGRRDLDFTSHPNDDGEPWERFSESRPNSLAGVVFRNRVLNSGHPSKYWPCRMTAQPLPSARAPNHHTTGATEYFVCKMTRAWCWKEYICTQLTALNIIATKYEVTNELIGHVDFKNT